MQINYLLNSPCTCIELSVEHSARCDSKTYFVLILVLVFNLLFADDAVLAALSQEAMQAMITSFAHACKEFGLTIGIKKTNIMTQDITNALNITIDNNTLEVVSDFTYLGSALYCNLSVDPELDRRATPGKASVGK